MARQPAAGGAGEPRPPADGWRALLRAAPVPLLAVDPTGVVRVASRGAARLLGRAEADVVGQRAEAVLTPELRPEVSTVDGWTVVAPHDPRDADTQRVRRLEAAGQEQEALLRDLMRFEERERRRIAAGVHDDSLQVITAAMLRLQQLRNRLRDPEALELLGRLEESISLAADRLRRLIFDFRPPALERCGLAAALRDTLARMHDDFGLEVHLRDELSAEPTPPTRLLLFRISQEALANVGQHAAASRVEVVLSERDGGYLVRIADDGVGIRRAQRTPRGHLGVTLMRERAEFAGGRFRIDSARGAGTTVTVWVPAGAGLDTPAQPPSLRGCDPSRGGTG
jgi:signal transduction histidine kinase